MLICIRMCVCVYSACTSTPKHPLPLSPLQMLTKNTTLRHLELGACGITQAGADMLKVFFSQVPNMCVNVMKICRCSYT